MNHAASSLTIYLSFGVTRELSNNRQRTKFGPAQDRSSINFPGEVLIVRESRPRQFACRCGSIRVVAGRSEFEAEDLSRAMRVVSRPQFSPRRINFVSRYRPLLGLRVI